MRSSTKNATNITLHSKPAPQNTTGTMVQYVSNATLHAHLGISYVHEVIHQKCNKHHTTLETRSSKHYWHHGAICFQCNTTRRSRHIIRTWGHPQKCNKHHTRPETHETPLLKTREENRQLKRNWPIDLIWGTGDSPLDDSPSRHCNNHNISLQNVNSDSWFKL
jgi:hypothetical protein